MLCVKHHRGSGGTFSHNLCRSLISNSHLSKKGSSSCHFSLVFSSRTSLKFICIYSEEFQEKIIWLTSPFKELKIELAKQSCHYCLRMQKVLNSYLFDLFILDLWYIRVTFKIEYVSRIPLNHIELNPFLSNSIAKKICKFEALMGAENKCTCHKDSP